MGALVFVLLGIVLVTSLAHGVWTWIPVDGGWGSPWGYEDANISDPTDSTRLDPMVQSPDTSSFLCEVVPQTGEASLGSSQKVTLRS